MASKVKAFYTVFSSPQRTKAESVVEMLRHAGYHPCPISPRTAPVYCVNVPVEEIWAAGEILAEADV